jgi:hypothetical protein
MRSLLPFRDFSEYKESAWALIAANMLPLLGVVFLGWDTFSIVALYWVENVIIGAINVLKMIASNPNPAAVNWSKYFKPTDEFYRTVLEARKSGMVDKVQMANHGSKLFFVPFFIFHYGLFCLVHGAFIFAMFGREDMGDFGPFGGFENILRVFSDEHLWLGVIALATSHLWSFFVNFLGNGEYRRTAVPILMGQPYARVVVLHMAILLGGFVSFALGSNVLVLMILIAGKTMLDLSLHLLERERNAPAPEPPPILPEVIMEDQSPAPATPAASAQSRPPARSSLDD